eukprot:2598584-Pyramimonas_sp.AAC.1
MSEADSPSGSQSFRRSIDVDNNGGRARQTDLSVMLAGPIQTAYWEYTIMMLAGFKGRAAGESGELDTG